jgi:hypothetical protein
MAAPPLDKVPISRVSLAQLPFPQRRHRVEAGYLNAVASTVRPIEFSLPKLFGIALALMLAASTRLFAENVEKVTAAK